MVFGDENTEKERVHFMSLRKIHPDMIDTQLREDITREIEDKINEGSLETNDRIEEVKRLQETNKYIHPDNHPASMILTDANNRFVTDTEKSNWNNKANNTVATTTVNGLMSKEDKVKINGIATGATNTIIDNVLTSTSTSNALSAYQGKLLNDKVVALETKAVKLDNISQSGVTTSNNGTAFGYNTTASGSYSHVEGQFSKATGNYSHAEGNSTTAIGASSHAEGQGAESRGQASHAEGIATRASGMASHTEGYNTMASGNYSHAEGYNTTASGNSSHAEGGYGNASGEYSHAEGSTTTASGNASHAEGTHTKATGKYSHSEGNFSTASGESSHAEGYETIASGSYSHAEGYATMASGGTAHAEGRNTKAIGAYSHAEGDGTIAYNTNASVSGNGSIAGSGIVRFIKSVDYTNKKIQLETPYPSSIMTTQSTTLYLTGGTYNTRGNIAEVTYSSYDNSTGVISYLGDLATSTYDKLLNITSLPSDETSSSAKGVLTISSGFSSSSEGNRTVASGSSSHAEGQSTIATGNYSHAEGYLTKAQGLGSHAEGSGSVASGDYSHAEGRNTTASGSSSHAEGNGTISSGVNSHAEGINTISSGANSHAGGAYTEASVYASTALGRYNKAMTGSATGINSTDDAFVIGGGTSTSAKANAFRVRYNGSVYGLSAFNSTGADYAEYFEWIDGKEEDEDRVGYFVALNGEKIRKATSKDDYILGITSVNPSVVGDSWQDEWNEKYVKDEWGRIQYHYVDVPAQIENIPTDKVDDEGNIIFEEVEVSLARQDYVPILNPNWNSEIEYVPREQRKEWSPIGMMGKLLVRDDGTCKVNSYCKPNDDGIATASDTNNGFRVMKRVSENMIYVLIK